MKRNKDPKVPKFKKPNVNKKRHREVLLGTVFLFFAILVLFSITSFFFNWKADQSSIEVFSDREVGSDNILNKLGAFIGHYFVYSSVGIGAYIFCYLLLITGLFFFLGLSKKTILNQWRWGFFYMIWISIFLAFQFKNTILSGVLGFEMNDFFKDYIGTVGVAILLIFSGLCFLIIHWKIIPEDVVSIFLKNKPLIFKPTKTNTPPFSLDINKKENVTSKSVPNADFFEKEIAMEIEPPINEEKIEENLGNKAIQNYGEFDPTLELEKYLFPKSGLLKKYTQDETITINEAELDLNKDRIVETLKNYQIEIVQIKATVGPTVTLYEIVPRAGIRISKIKNLEDDIALSLSALGIRIIAPIPGKGTIGIEVPNQNPSIVSMQSVIFSKKFQEAEMELPIALGKTISNEIFVVDLIQMPHLLMAGATGQGKSVGLNVILTCLLYKKHPAEVKFVLVDPKKVELSIYNKIEQYYLAKLPDSDEAIITDNKKVINTLHSLCIEMDARYELLKNAGCRNLKEYNAKFKKRRLNPEKGHRFLPYIVLLVDEFADLIMTAGKEVETPIARLAQLARAIGIHLIIATQRPSVNVITGVIKANFPARIAFRVTSKIDSRTILDSGGADQLVGRGDLLYTQGNDITRIQCAFVDTPEVKNIVNYIGSQTGYASAYNLPEYKRDEEEESLEDNPEERDELFKNAAEIIVTAQQGSASLLQRKLRLGYNRAGRIIDQMEAAGIVGPFEGSKARKVLISDLTHLDQFLKNN